ILAPARETAVARDGAAVLGSRDDPNDRLAGERAGVDDGDGGGSLGAGAVTELAERVRTPAEGLAGCHETRVAEADRDPGRNGSRDHAARHDRHRNGLVIEGPRAECALAAVAPAHRDALGDRARRSSRP